MPNQKQFFTDRSDLRAILAKGKYTTLALTDGNDSYILTLNYGLDKTDDILYFKSSPYGTKMDFFKSNSYLSGTVIQDNGYQVEKQSHYYCSVVYSGLLEVIHKSDEKLKALNCLFNQLEDIDQDSAISRDITDRELSDIFIMKLTIDEMRGKRNPPESRGI